MSDRDKIFSAIRSALEPLKERTELPDWADDLPYSSFDDFPSLWERLSFKMSAVHGTPLDGLDALAEYFKKENLKCGYCDPKLLPMFKNHGGFEAVEWRTEFSDEMPTIDEFEFGITLASAAIAETGTVVLKDKDTSARLAALAPWMHIAILQGEAKIHRCVLDAVQSLGDDPSVIWCTGPSKTADVEGILIEGVHGPGVQVLCKVED